MRSTFGPMATGLVLIAVATVEARAQYGARFDFESQVGRSLLERLNPLPSRDSSPVSIEGLPKDQAGGTLTWERAYKLAILRSHSRDNPLAPALDARALDEQIARIAIPDPALARLDFRARGGAGFHDPSASYFDLLARSGAVEQARNRLASLENLLGLLREMVVGESSGLGEIQVDRANESLQRARLDLLERLMRYRDALDEIKVELGLSPRAAVVLDRSPLAKFTSTFQDASRWSADPSREVRKMLEIAEGLPRLGDFSAADRSLLEVAEGQFLHSGDPEAFVAAVGQLAIAGRKGADAPRELDARKKARKLLELAIAYRVECRQFHLIMRSRAAAQEQLFAPRQPRPDAGFDVANLVDLLEQLNRSEDRLVDRWTSYHSLKLALSRDLGLLAVGDWKAFHDRMLLGQEDPARARPASPPVGEGPPRQAPPIAPPAPAPPLPR